MIAFSSPLTVKQANILRFLDVFIAEEGRSPSVREIADAFDEASTGGATRCLGALEQLAFIRRAAPASGPVRGLRPRREIVILRRAPLFLVVERADAAAGAA